MYAAETHSSLVPSLRYAASSIVYASPLSQMSGSISSSECIPGLMRQVLPVLNHMVVFSFYAQKCLDLVNDY